MRGARVLTGKNGVAALMLALKEADIKVEAIPVHMHLGQTAAKQKNNKGVKNIVMVYAGHTNETTTLFLPTEEECGRTTSEDHDLGYIKSILSGPEGEMVYPK